MFHHLRVSSTSDIKFQKIRNSESHHINSDLNANFFYVALLFKSRHYFPGSENIATLRLYFLKIFHMELTV